MPTTVTDRIERPTLRIAEFSVVLHVVCEDAPDGPRRRDPDSPFRSYERDMFSYAYRDVPPLQTTLGPGPEPVTVDFPTMRYESESRRHRSVPGSPAGRRLRLRTAVSSFPTSGLSVLHLAFGPADGSTLDEYEIVKLTKLWEGGEGLPAAGSDQEAVAVAARELPSFTFAGRAGLTVDALVAEVFQGAYRPRRHLVGPPARSGRRAGKAAGARSVGSRVGTVEVSLPGDEPWFFDALALLRADRGEFERHWDLASRDREDWARLVAVGGIVQGLLDFDRIEAPELADVFAALGEKQRSLYSAGLSVTGFHKGTLLQLTASSPVDTADRELPLASSPYLVVTQAVLVHNNERLRTSLAHFAELHRPAGAPLSRARLNGTAPSIATTAALVDEQRLVLGQLLTNVFHYPSERTLFIGGQTKRGLDDLAVDLTRRLAVESQQLEARLKRRDTYSVIAGIALTVAGALQAAGGSETLVPWWVAISVLGVVVAGYLTARYIS